MPSESWASLMSKAEAPQTASGKVLAKGTYRVQIKAVKASEKSGKDRLALLLEVIEGDEKGEKFWDNWTVSPESPKALGIFFENFARCGGSLEVLQAGGKLSVASNSMADQLMDVTLDIEEWPAGSGRLRNKTGFYRKAQGEAPVSPVAGGTKAGAVKPGTVKGPF